MRNTQKNKRISGVNDIINIGLKKSPVLLLAVIGILLITNIFTFYVFKTRAVSSGDSCVGNYSFINPRFACGYKNIIDKKGYSEFKFKLSEYIKNKQNEGKADIIAVWFRDLESGPTFGINDRKDFIPASLLKLPMVLTFFQLAEDDPDILQHLIYYSETNSKVPTQTFLPRNRIENNKTYTVEDLIGRSIIDSDNYAAQLLYEHLEKFNKGELSRTYRDLGILEPGHDLNASAVNTKGYGSIFRMLYNVSFLDNELSEKLLSLLAQTYFNDGLRAGVPENIVIAHKFGERYLEDGSKQLHDCGIVYYPGNPYQLCIMTRGGDFDDLKNIIGEISKEVYEEFDSRRID